MTTIAKVRKSGSSQTIRIPKEFRIKSKTVIMTKHGSGITLTDPDDLARRRRALDELYKNPPPLPELERP